jgi:hypothetical protein
VNAPLNPFGADASRVQLTKPENQWVIALMRRYGFFWLGPPIKDWMHFSFVGSPADARQLTAQAEDELGGEMADFADYVDGIDRYWAAFVAKNGDPGGAPASLPPLSRKGWTHARRGALNPQGSGGQSGLNYGDNVTLSKPI